MKKRSSISIINGVVFFVLGIIIFLNPELLVKTISYGLGIVLILIGIYRCVNYYIQDKRMGIVNRNEIAFGITAIVLGIIFIFLAGAIELLIRFIVGGWFVIAGINKILKTFFITNRDSKFYALIVVGLIFVGIGLYIILVSNLALSIIGLFMMIYGIIDFISFFVYKPTIEDQLTEDIEDNIISTKEKPEEKEEIIIETEFVEKKNKKRKNN